MSDDLLLCAFSVLSGIVLGQALAILAEWGNHGRSR